MCREKVRRLISALSTVSIELAGRFEAYNFISLFIKMVIVVVVCACVFLELSELSLPVRTTVNIMKAIIITTIMAPIRSFLKGMTTILV